MTREQYLLISLMEECAEVQQRASKALRFGLGDTPPDSTETNAELITKEFGDALALFTMMEEEGLVKEPSRDHFLRKKLKVKIWSRYSQKRGILKKRI